ncbi:MAG: glycerol acyltransferase [Microscillaceae bacterium]|nr:glycerol acyltransferase [Microscillaceae bacterium]
MLYFILRLIAQIALKVFFRRIQVKYRERLPRKGPMLVVSNHPNTFMDPLLLASLLRPQVYFLANASIFNTPLNRWLLRQLNMIPIQRKHDTNQQKFDNQHIFQKCYEFLGRKGTLMIFPEGTSIHARRLQEIKKGTARIALGAEEAYQFGLDLKIVTVGINYSRPDGFRSEVFISVDEPILVKEYQTEYEKDPFKAVDALTEAIREKIAAHIIITDNEVQDSLAREVELIYKRQLSEEIQLAEKTGEQAHLISKAIAEAVRYFAAKDLQRVERLRKQVKMYHRNLERLDLNDEVFSANRLGKGLLGNSLGALLLLLLGLPLFLYGCLFNYVPYILPSRVAARVVNWTSMYEYTAPVMMLTGVFTFPLFYALLLVGASYASLSGWGLFFFFLSLPLSGFFALAYARFWEMVEDKGRLLAIFFRRASLVAELVKQRQSLLKEFEKAKEEYQSFLLEKSPE